VYASDEVRLSPQIDGVLLPVGVALLVVAGLVLLLACSNLANLVLVRGLARSPEMIVRRALGAGPGRISRLFLVEALLLSSLGGVAGLLAAKWAIDLFPRLPLPLPEGMILDVGIDGRVLAFGAILALSSGAIFGVLPSLRVGGDDLAAGLREDLRSGTDGKRGTLLRNGLVAIQVAAAVVLLIGAGLFARSLANVRGADTGVDVERIAVLGLDTSRGGTSTDVAPLLFREIQDRVVTLPGVTAAAVSTQLPARTLGGTTTIVEGYVPPTGTEAVELAFSYVSPGYFETMGIRLLEGRDFSLDDRPENPRVIIVNETAARVFWGGEGLGKRTRSQGANTQWREVVGVVADAKVGSLQEPPTPMMYYSTSQGSFSCCFVIARTAGDPEALLPSMNAVAAEIAPGVPITTLGTFASVLGEGFAGPRAAAALMGVFSALALVLAGLGIYAVVAFAVLRRAGEMGIRVALGATRSQVARLVLKDSLASSGIGLGVGLVAAFGLTPGLEGLLFQVGVVDPAIFLGAAAFLLAVTLTASWFPAWRAASADPAQVLRAR
jgi:predicted permease